MRARLALALTVVAALPLAGQGAGGARPALRTIEERTASMRKLDGFFPLYFDSAGGQLFMEIPRLNTEVLHVAGMGAGLGSNDIGIDRGGLLGSRLVVFERSGPRVLMVQPNQRFRSTSTNPIETRTIRDAFARSVLWGFNVAAESDGGRRVLVDMTDFLIRDAYNLGGQMQGYRLENSRSSIYAPMTQNFPKNTEMEAELTFVPTGAGGGGGRGGGFFEGVGSVAATGEAASVRVHQSFVELPDTAGYKHRAYDPRSGMGAFTYLDYAAPLGRPQQFRSVRRHRLAKANPSAAVSDPVKPIIYYLDPGTPEPIRTALLEGGRWWNQAFEAAGYRNAFRVEILPEGASPLDIRYNVINWVHRSTRGWSSGASVTDPRTGEILKGVVTLGSLRIRQDMMILEGLLQPYRTGADTAPEIRRWALQRIRQLSAHEIGHTLGYGHNYYNSTAGRISVLDYPHPLLTLKPDGTLDIAQMYTNEIGEWDKVSVMYGYSDFPPGTNEAAALKKILDDAWAKDLRYMSNADLEVGSKVDWWVNGTDNAGELDRLMEIRRVALSRFGENAIKIGMPMAQLEDVLVPLYLHHRYAVESTAGVLGGQDYIYAFRGDGRTPTRPAPAAAQRAALTSLMATISPSALALPTSLLSQIPPRPPGYGMTRELFPRYTGGAFDVITPAVAAAGFTMSQILDDARSARLVEQKALDPTLPGLDDVIEALRAATFGATARTPYEEEVKRATQRVFVDELMSVASGAPMPQVRALATLHLRRIAAGLPTAGVQTADLAQTEMLATDIKRFLERPWSAADIRQTPAAPPGAPIGDPGMDWLNRIHPPCAWHGWWDYPWSSRAKRGNCTCRSLASLGMTLSEDISMRNLSIALAGSLALAGAADAQQKPLPTVDQQVAAAVQALPANMRANATVFGFKTPGKMEVIKQGTNGMNCLAQFVVEARFHVSCYHEGMEPFMGRGRELRAQGITVPARLDSIRYAEVREGKIKMPERAALYQVFGDSASWDPATGALARTTSLFVVYVPGATTETTGLPATPQPNNGPWLMNAGTPKAHIMFTATMGGRP
jgi:hypothetical protein